MMSILQFPMQLLRVEHTSHMMGVGGIAQEAMEGMRQVVMSPQGNSRGVSSSSSCAEEQSGTSRAAEHPCANPRALV